MPFSEELALRERRVRHLGFVRLFLATGYLVAEVAGNPAGAGAGKWGLGLLFGAYAAILVVPRVHSLVRNHAVRVLVGDLVAVSALVLWSDPGNTVLALLLFYFVLSQATLLHSAREVATISVIGIAVYAIWLARSELVHAPFPHGFLLLLLLVGGSLACYFAYRRFRKEREISMLLEPATGQGEAELISAVEAALEQLTLGLRCSGASPG